MFFLLPPSLKMGTGPKGLETIQNWRVGKVWPQNYVGSEMYLQERTSTYNMFLQNCCIWCWCQKKVEYAVIQLQNNIKTENWSTKVPGLIWEFHHKTTDFWSENVRQKLDPHRAEKMWDYHGQLAAERPMSWAEVMKNGLRLKVKTEVAWWRGTPPGGVPVS
jgi:hypothetical protein